MMLYLIFISSFLLIPVNPLSISKDYHFSPNSKHNKSYYYPKYRHELYYDNKVIPEDMEIDVFLHKHKTQKLFYLLEGSYRPISVTITPCTSDSTLEWKISHNMFPPTDGDSSYDADPWTNHVLRPPSISPAAAYVGNDRRSYTNPLAPPGLYTLELRSNVETRVKILVTTRSTSQMPYHPPLPPEPGVQIIKVKRNRVLISWKASLSSRHLEYCVTSNTNGNYNSLCSAETDLYGGISFHRQMSSSYSFTYPSKYLHNSLKDNPKHGATMTCIGRKTWHMFKGLQRGKTYYFDVFVLDTETNASSAYVGVSATVKNVPALPSRLKDDSLAVFNLNHHNSFSVTTKYNVAKNAGHILLFVQSCTGPGPVTLTITQNGSPKQEILTASIMDVKTLQVPNRNTNSDNSSNIYILTIRTPIIHERKVRVWISSKKHAFPFPVLPQDKSVSVFDTLTTCDSVTIGWKASPDERVKYCIYRQIADEDLIDRTMNLPQNFCDSPTNVNKKRHTVLCRRYHRFSKRRFNNVIMQRIRGLLPGTSYIFEVHVTKVKGKMLPYEHVWAQTLDSCSHSRNKR